MRLPTKRLDHVSFDAPRGSHVAHSIIPLETKVPDVTGCEKAIVRDHIRTHQQPGDPDFFDMLGVTA